MRLLSPRELADALGVSESSLKRWVDAGKITAARTDGGHRRISLPEAVRFIRETGAPIARPELLDMPEVAAVQAHARGPRGDDAFRHYLLEGDAAGARGWLLARYLAGQTVEELCDGPVRVAMHRIGEVWAHDAEGIFIEHRATDACLQALAHLRSTFEPPHHAPLAVGGGPEDDPYIVPSFMAAMVLAAAGLRAVNLGPDTPVSAFDRAFAHLAPALVWISASAEVPPARAKELERWLLGLPPATTIAIGGRSGDDIAPGRARIHRVESMTQLAALAVTIKRSA
ncbi:MAG TPA: helix-turn-helix domain-containing protein [Kofleriaceae bacterium]|nr:helix-turn-helix domain-containing protein [Kofleriaceae bacterium]